MTPNSYPKLTTNSPESQTGLAALSVLFNALGPQPDRHDVRSTGYAAARRLQYWKERGVKRASIEATPALLKGTSEFPPSGQIRPASGDEFSQARRGSATTLGMTSRLPPCEMHGRPTDRTAGMRSVVPVPIADTQTGGRLLDGLHVP